MIQVFALFAVLQLASSLELYNINESFDEKLEKHNNASHYLIPFMKNKTVSVGPFTFSEGVLIGANSGYRLGNATRRVLGEGTVYVEERFGWRLMAVAFGKVRHGAKTMSGLFRVRENAFHSSYYLRSALGGCAVSVDRFRFAVLDDVRLEASLPEFDGLDLSTWVSEELLPEINQHFLKLQHVYQKKLEESLCRGVGEVDLQSFVISGLGQYFSPN